MKIDILLPRRMKALQRDSRGYPVPFNVIRDLDGKPCFTMNDTRRIVRSLTERRCSICGNRLDRDMWFLGGPRSAFDPHGAYVDTPEHHECMTYALQVCPYLAAPRYLGRIDLGNVNLDRLAPEHQMVVDQTMLPDRPPLFVAVRSRQLTLIPSSTPGTAPHVRPVRPYSDVEFWQYGKRLTYEEGMRQSAEVVPKERIERSLLVLQTSAMTT